MANDSDGTILGAPYQAEARPGAEPNGSASVANGTGCSPLLEDLLGSGIPPDAAQALISGGHYRTVSAAEAKQLVGVAAPGWVVQFRDIAGNETPFVRLKPVPALSQRGDKKPPKYLSKAGAGCRVYFSPLLHKAARDPKEIIDLDITEGEKKTDCANAHSFATIGLSGVDCYRDKTCKPGGILPELAAIKWWGRTVRIAYDSDAAHKEGVQSAMESLALILAKRGAKVLITTIPCEIPDGPGNPTPEKWKNGADDFIHRHGADAYRIARNLARECVKNISPPDKPPIYVWDWDVEPSGHGGNRLKALLARSVFKESFAVDPNLGALHWCGTHWEVLSGKPEERLARPFLHWCDAMGWKDTGLGTVSRQLIEELRVERQWNPPHLLAFSNGTLDTRTNTFRPGHRRDNYLTTLHPFAFDPAAQCPRWLQFVAESLEGRESGIALLRAAIRWTLEPKDRTQPFPAEHCFDISGRRGTGKGTLAEVVVGLVGGTEQGAGRLDAKSLDNPAALFGLVGKRIAFDPDASGHIANAGIFNALASNEPVLVKKLYVNEYSARLGVVLWRFFNDEITVSGGGEEGMGRRIIPFHFNVQPKRRDQNLKHQLRTELPGIFAWAWSLPLPEALRTLATAAGDTETLNAAIDAAMARNPKLRFLAEKYPAGDAAAEANHLFAEWKRWCDREGHHHGNKATFGAEIRKVTGTPTRTGKAKQTSYCIPAMDAFDYADFLGLETGREGVDVDSPKVDVDPPKGGRCVDVDSPKVDVDYCVSSETGETGGRRPSESTSTQRPPQRPLNVHSTSTQTPCYDSKTGVLGPETLSEKKGEAGEGRKVVHGGTKTGKTGEALQKKVSEAQINVHPPSETPRNRVLAIPQGAPVEIREPDRPAINGHRMLNTLGKSEHCQLTDPSGGTVQRPKAWVWPCSAPDPSA